MKKYYSFEESGGVLDIYIFGDIVSYPWDESDVTSFQLSQKIGNSTATTINVYINSYGGEVKEGIAIYNTLKSAKAIVNTYVEGFACSIASVIFMAGKNRFMHKTSAVMIHNAWTRAVGDSNELKKCADDLELITNLSKQAYLEQACIEEEQLTEFMDSEKWMNCDEAISFGFATAILEEDTEFPTQSARQGVLRHLSQKENKHPVLTEATIAKAVAEELKTVFGKSEQEDEQKPKENYFEKFVKAINY